MSREENMQTGTIKVERKDVQRSVVKVFKLKIPHGGKKTAVLCDDGTVWAYSAERVRNTNGFGTDYKYFWKNIPMDNVLYGTPDQGGE